MDQHKPYALIGYLSIGHVENLTVNGCAPPSPFTERYRHVPEGLGCQSIDCISIHTGNHTRPKDNRPAPVLDGRFVAQEFPIGLESKSIRWRPHVFGTSGAYEDLDNVRTLDSIGRNPDDALVESDPVDVAAAS